MAILPPDPLFCLKSDMGHVHNLCFLSKESRTTDLLAATESGFVYFWDLQTNRVRNKQNVGKSVQAIHCTSENLVTQEKSGRIKLWGVQNETDYELIKECECSGGYCRSILVDNILILPQANSTLDAVELKTMNRKVEIGSNVYVLAGFETGDIILWDFLTGKPCSHLRLRECITSLTFDALTGRGICGNSSNVLQVFTIDKDFNIKLKCEISITNEGCNIVKLRPDRKIFVCGGWDGRLRLFSWKSLRLLAVLNQHRKSVTDVQFSPTTVAIWDSNVMAASGADGVISLWSLYN